MATDVRYTHEALAWEYDQRNAELAPGELAWYLKYASLAGGPILELGCGSGRLLLPIAEAGYSIDGVDVSPAMLARCQQKLTALGPETRRRVHLICADMAKFTPERPYGLVFLAYNSLRYLASSARYLAVFEHAYQCLDPVGYFLLMTAPIDLSRYADGRVVVVDWLAQPIVDSELGLAVGSKFVSRLDQQHNKIVTERTYRIERRGIATETIHDVTEMPVVSVAEYRTLLEKSGFVARVYDGYDERTISSSGSILCFVCRKT